LSHEKFGKYFVNQERYQEAQENYDKALKIREVTLGNIHPDTTASYDNIGNLSIKKYIRKSFRKL